MTHSHFYLFSFISKSFFFFPLLIILFIAGGPQILLPSTFPPILPGLSTFIYSEFLLQHRELNGRMIHLLAISDTSKHFNPEMQN